MISYIRGPVVFTGVRTPAANPVRHRLLTQNELECIVVKSPFKHKATVTSERTRGGQNVLIPPVYELEVDYMRLGSDGRTVSARKCGRVIVGNFGAYEKKTNARRVVHARGRICALSI